MMLNAFIVAAFVGAIALLFFVAEFADWYIRYATVYSIPSWLVGMLIVGICWKKFPKFSERFGVVLIFALFAHLVLHFSAA